VNTRYVAQDHLTRQHDRNSYERTRKTVVHTPGDFFHFLITALWGREQWAAASLNYYCP